MHLCFFPSSVLWLFITTVYLNQILVPFFFYFIKNHITSKIHPKSYADFSLHLHSVNPSLLSTFWSQLLLRLQSLWQSCFILFLLSVPFFSSRHALSTYSGIAPGLIQKEYSVKLVLVPLQSVLTCDEDRRGEVLEKWRWERMRGEKSERSERVSQIECGHPAVVLCLAGESAFRLLWHLCNHSCTHAERKQVCQHCGLWNSSKQK